MLQIWLKISLLFIGGGVILGILIASTNHLRTNYEFSVKQDFWYSNFVMWGIWIIISIFMWGFYLIDLI